MRAVKDAANRILSVVGLVALAILGVALLGAGLIVGLALIGLLATAYAISRIFFKGRFHVRTVRIASCPSCGSLTDKKVCECGARVSWL
ncbi:MAG: hypothetical protein HYS81_01565 [Candidatus Aenigmatarchaeota archaeon]|nr:MAG: hypothetical protein HYS81_01565 [Candidatus Aenigmarchaeota archaeon]